MATQESPCHQGHVVFKQQVFRTGEGFFLFFLSHSKAEQRDVGAKVTIGLCVPTILCTCTDVVVVWKQRAPQVAQRNRASKFVTLWVVSPVLNLAPRSILVRKEEGWQTAKAMWRCCRASTKCSLSSFQVFVFFLSYCDKYCYQEIIIPFENLISLHS